MRSAGIRPELIYAYERTGLGNKKPAAPKQRVLPILPELPEIINATPSGNMTYLVTAYRSAKGLLLPGVKRTSFRPAVMSPCHPKWTWEVRLGETCSCYAFRGLVDRRRLSRCLRLND